jgi:leucine dehydrogenase
VDGWVFDYLERYDYENLVLCQDPAIGLKAIIAVHDTTLGPATGGTRMWTYPSESAAIEDALRLARGMTYKYAAAGVNLGGGKCVVIGDPKTDKSEALFRALGRFIQRLNGAYLTGEDVGTTLRDMEYMRLETPYVVTLPAAWGGAGPIAPATALGVLQGMRACFQAVFGSDTLAGRSVALQGLGMVGWEVLHLLTTAGARVIVSDIDADKVRRAGDAFGVEAVAPAEIHRQAVDVYCPCALGGVLNEQTLPELRCRVVAGSANNQLGTERDGERLHELGILYAPDYVINAGGTIFDTDRLYPGGFNQARAMANVERIFETMGQLIRIKDTEGVPTYKAADLLAERRIEAVRRVQAFDPRPCAGVADAL